MSALPPLESGQGGCLCCPPKPLTAPLDMRPHPGFGGLVLTRDGETPDEWWSFAGEVIDVDAYYVVRREEAVTLAEIEEACADDPDHDWRLRIDGPLTYYVYQRQGCAQWVLVDKGQGFA